ncbi:MAG: CDP-diacylglycerol pyrophosphatase [Bryobacterales bacterium]|nr:CDP-diacylglycerol pyrophosphatase [Bryobacterales bacterium]
MRFRLILLLLAACAGQADVRNCNCDLASPSVSETRSCSLCLEAEKHPSTERVVLTRDIDPTKPNRWLAIPRATYDGANPLAQMPAEERLLLWNTAVTKAKEVWGADAWAIAMNGDISRRQCHAHVHIGKLLDEKKSEQIETAGIFLDGPVDLPAISDGTGIWFHPIGNRLHVHLGDQTTETVLMR